MSVGGRVLTSLLQRHDVVPMLFRRTIIQKRPTGGTSIRRSLLVSSIVGALLAFAVNLAYVLYNPGYRQFFCDTNPRLRVLLDLCFPKA